MDNAVAVGDYRVLFTIDDSAPRIHLRSWTSPRDLPLAIVALAKETQSVELHAAREYAEASREKPPRADTLARRIAEVDAAIDAAVYRLYDLSAEEIAIVVEGGT